MLTLMKQIIGLIDKADTLLETSWQKRNWTTFIKTWLMASLGMAVFALVTPPIVLIAAGIIYTIIAVVLGAFGANVKFLTFDYSIIGFSVAFSTMMGLLTLIFTVPAMLIKEVSGDFKTNRRT